MQHIKYLNQSLFGLFLLFATHIANADVVVLIHGYMGSPNSWEESHVNDVLSDAGWKRGGVIVPDTRQFFANSRLANSRYTNKSRANSRSTKPKNISYMVDMPWMRPLAEQADYLKVAMDQILKMRPNEKISLIAHSAGALAARLWLVQHYDPAVVRMVSIAAPNLGTSRAIDALDLTDPTFAPFDAVRNMFGGKLYNTVRHSRELVYDFTPPDEKNPNILFWLNQQPHPDIEYVAIVREDRRGRDKDWLISANSQDLNNVPALHGKVQSYIVPRRHPLNFEDGFMLAKLLSKSS